MFFLSVICWYVLGCGFGSRFGTFFASPCSCFWYVFWCVCLSTKQPFLLSFLMKNYMTRVECGEKGIDSMMFCAKKNSICFPQTRSQLLTKVFHPRNLGSESAGFSVDEGAWLESFLRRLGTTLGGNV